MGIRIRKFGEFLHVESGIWENLTRGIRNPGLWNLEYSSKNLELIPLTIGIQNPAHVPLTKNCNPESMAWNLESCIS